MNARRDTGWQRFIEGGLIISAILFFSFFLIRSYPGNQPELRSSVISQSEISNNETSISENIDKYKWNKPSFYCSVIPSFLDRRYYEITHEELYKKSAITYQPSHILHQLWENIEAHYPNSDQRLLLENLSSGTVDKDLLREEDQELYELLELDSRGGLALLPKFVWYGSDNQFHYWLKQVFSSAGRSLYDGVPIWGKVWHALKWTLAVQLPAFIMFFILGIGWGLVSRLSKSNFIKGMKKILLGFYAIPLFALSMLILLLSQYVLPDNLWSISPLGKGELTFTAFFSTHMKFFVLPWISIVLHQFVYVALQTEATIGREMNRRYILAARSRGSSKREALITHALPNAATPLITIAILMLPALVSGSIVIETIFNIPGIGRLFIDSLFQGDWGVTLALILMTSIIGYISLWLGDIWYYHRDKIYRTYV